MSRRGRRYDDNGPKLNVKKIIAVIVFILVIVMFVIGIKYMLEDHSENASGRIETITYYTAYDNGKWGVINSNGEVVINPSYDEMIVIPDNTKAVFLCVYDMNYENNTYKTKAINAKEKEIIKGYDTIDTIANYDKKQNMWYETNVLKVKKGNKYGLCNIAGKETLSCEYDNIEPIKGIQNSLLISKEGKYGLCDNTGNIIIEPKYKKVDKIQDDYKNGYIVIDENDKAGIIGIDKSVILKCDYEEIKPVIGTNLFIVKSNGKYIAINKEGETILEDKFDDVEGINGEIIIAKKGNKIGLLDINGETKVKFDYEEIKNAGEYYIAKKNDKYGIIDIQGEGKLAHEAIDISYYASGKFFIVDYLENDNIQSKVIDTNFETKVTGIVTEVNEEKGYFRLYEESGYKYYNFKFEEKSASSILTTNTLFLSKKDGKYGFIDKQGNVVVDYIYDDATEQNSSGYAGIKKDGLWGSIDSKGKVIVEPEYNLDNNTKIDFIGSWHLGEDINANYYLDV